MTANTPTFHIKYTETTSSFDHDSTLQRRKVPRLALSTDVKSFSNCHSHTTSAFAQMPHSSSGALSQMDVDEVILHQNNNPKTGRSLRPKRSLEEHSTPFIDFSTTACTFMLPSSSQQSPSYPQRILDTRFHKPCPSRLQPSSFYPSPPQSTITSPLDVSSPLPPPIQPSPSLPLHQPRPSRRIPIVSLSRLASAAEKMENPFPRRANMHKERLDPVSRNVYPSTFRRSPYSRADRDRQVGVASRQDGTNERFVQCGCGCMESYAVG